MNFRHVGMNLKDIKSKLKWQDYVLLIIIIIYLIFQFNLISQFQQLPSPLYGGDLYHQLGAINHVKYGGNPFKSFTNSDPLPSYFPLYTFLIGNFAKLFNLNAITAMFFSSYILMILSIMIMYIFSYLLFKNKTIALFTTLFFNSLACFPVLKYTLFTQKIVFPLFFLFLFLTLKTNKYIYATLAGLVYGLGSISHGTFFIEITLLIPILVGYSFFAHKKEKLLFKKDFRTILIIFLIGFLIAQVYWFKPIFIYHGNIPNKITEWGQVNYSLLRVQMKFVFESLKKIFFDFHTLFSSMISILCIFAIFFIFSLKKHILITKYLSFLSISLFVIPFHFLLTIPLFGLEFSPHYMAMFSFGLLKPLLASFSIFIFIHSIKNTKKLNLVLIILLILIVLGSISEFNKKVKEDKWIRVGMQPLPSYLFEVSNWIIENTNVNDKFLSTKEIGSAINALTGRKFVSIRRNQHSIISEVDQREADLAVMLYGNNDSLREKLFKKYDIKYLYWDYYWLNSEFQFDQEGNFIGYFDPIMVIKSNKFIDYFESNNISFKEEYMVIDSAKRNNPDIKKFHVLVVYPTYFNVTHPWSKNLDKYLNLEKEIKYQGIPIARVYKISAKFV